MSWRPRRVALGVWCACLRIPLIATAPEWRPEGTPKWVTTAWTIALGLSLVAPPLLVQFAIVFFLAGSCRPWWLLATVRRSGWLALIKDDAVVRAIGSPQQPSGRSAKSAEMSK